MIEGMIMKEEVEAGVLEEIKRENECEQEAQVVRKEVDRNDRILKIELLVLEKNLFPETDLYQMIDQLLQEGIAKENIKLKILFFFFCLEMTDHQKVMET